MTDMAGRAVIVTVSWPPGTTHVAERAASSVMWVGLGRADGPADGLEAGSCDERAGPGGPALPPGGTAVGSAVPLRADGVPRAAGVAGASPPSPFALVWGEAPEAHP